jgi:hypothetical protein
MLARLKTFTLLGIEAMPVDVEVDADLSRQVFFNPINAVHQILQIDHINAAAKQLIHQGAQVAVGVDVDDATRIARPDG